MKTSTLFRFLCRPVLAFGLFGCLCACHEADGSLPDPPAGNPAEYATLIAPLVKCMNLPRPADAYNYPLYPGMPAWATLSGSGEMRDACQIPVAVVQEQSTVALIWSIWEYPFFSEPLLVISSMRGAQAVANSSELLNLHAYRELLERKDNIACLLTCYQAMDPLSDPLVQTYAFEALLTADGLLPQIATAEKKAFIRAALEKDRLRVNAPDRSAAWRSVTWYFIGKLLQAASYPPFSAEIAGHESLADFLATSNQLKADSSTLEIIRKQAEAFIREN